MASKRVNPATLAACRARKSNCVSDYSDQNRQLQELRARFLARRYRLDPTIALAIAALAFAEEGARS